MNYTEQEKRILREQFDKMLEEGENTFQYVIARMEDNEIKRNGYIVKVKRLEFDDYIY